jgi:hypothetical protein
LKINSHHLHLLFFSGTRQLQSIRRATRYAYITIQYYSSTLLVVVVVVVVVMAVVVAVVVVVAVRTYVYELNHHHRRRVLASNPTTRTCTRCPLHVLEAR